MNAIEPSVGQVLLTLWFLYSDRGGIRQAALRRTCTVQSATITQIRIEYRRGGEEPLLGALVAGPDSVGTACVEAIQFAEREALRPSERSRRFICPCFSSLTSPIFFDGRAASIR